MNLIVFDLEWNIGYQPKTFLYHGAEITLRGEIIQIGAVRIHERGDVLDTFDMTLKPRIFRKLQHHIAKVTGLTQLDLDGGVPSGVWTTCRCSSRICICAAWTNAGPPAGTTCSASFCRATPAGRARA